MDELKKLKQDEQEQSGRQPFVIFQPYNGCHFLVAAVAVSIGSCAISTLLFIVWPLVN